MSNVLGSHVATEDSNPIDWAFSSSWSSNTGNCFDTVLQTIFTSARWVFSWIILFLTSVVAEEAIEEFTSAGAPNEACLIAGGVKTLVKSVYIDCIMLFTCRRKDGLKLDVVAIVDMFLLTEFRTSELVFDDSFLHKSKAEDSAERQDSKLWDCCNCTPVIFCAAKIPFRRASTIKCIAWSSDPTTSLDFSTTIFEQWNEWGFFAAVSIDKCYQRKLLD